MIKVVIKGKQCGDHNHEVKNEVKDADRDGRGAWGEQGAVAR